MRLYWCSASSGERSRGFSVIRVDRRRVIAREPLAFRRPVFGIREMGEFFVFISLQRGHDVHLET